MSGSNVAEYIVALRWAVTELPFKSCTYKTDLETRDLVGEFEKPPFFFNGHEFIYAVKPERVSTA